MMKVHSKLKYLSLVKQEHSESGYKLHPVIISWDDEPPLMRCSIEKQLPTLELIDERQTCWLIGQYKRLSHLM